MIVPPEAGGTGPDRFAGKKRRHRGSNRLIRNRVLLVLLLAGTAAALWLPLLSYAPNRIVAGKPIPLAAMMDGRLVLLLFPALFLMAGPFLADRKGTHALVAASAVLLATGLVAFAGAEASRLAGLNGPIGRTSFGGGCWVLLVASWLVFADAIRRFGLGSAGRILATIVVLAIIAAIVASGAVDDLSVMKEYSNRRDVFVAALLRHLQIVGMTMVPTIVIGLPLGLLSHRRPRLRAALLPPLNIVQTIPSIALFGLMFAPLTKIAATFPLLSRLGIGATGLTPAIVALTLYSLLPVVRATVAGLGQVPAGAVEAATGMGMTPGQVFCRVALPLALPPILSGLRVTVVQALGLAAVAALIGAGGLGAIMFQGLLSSALDLVLLAVVPMVTLAVAADAALKFAVAIVQARPQ